MFIQSTTFSQKMLKDLNQASLWSTHRNYVQVGNVTFFTATDGVHGTKLWKTDGTTGGTVLLKDIKSWINGSNSSQFVDKPYFTEIDDIIYFMADDEKHGTEMWRTDGTGANTSYVQYLVNTGTQLIFGTDKGFYGRELWEYTPGLEYTIISSNPSNEIICEGENASFSIIANNATFYQWQVDNGTCFADISGGIYSGENTNTLSLIAPSLDYYGYKCLAQNTGGNTESISATLYVISSPIADAGTDDENLCGLQYNLSANKPLNGGIETFDNENLNTVTFTADPDGTYILTCTVDNGNCEVNSNLEITLAENNTAPIMTYISNTTVTANQFHVYVVDGTEFDPTDITDNCAILSIENNVNDQETLANEQFDEGMHTINWTIIYNNGNITEYAYTITVNAFFGINNLSETEISVYPNPTTGLINLKISERPLIVEITNTTGKVLVQINSKSTSQAFDFSNYLSGIYFIKVQNENGVYTKIIIKK